MPIVRLKDVVDMDSKERDKKLSELRAELSRLKTMVSAGGAVENPARIKEIRKAIAKIMTIGNQQKKKEASEKRAAEVDNKAGKAGDKKKKTEGKNKK